MPGRIIAKKIIGLTDYLFSFLIFCTIVALIIYSILTILNLFKDVIEGEVVNIVHNIAFMIVLMKAYKILTFYLQSHNLSIKYLVQISIIAPAIEVIFAADAQPLSLTILFSVYSLASLLVYLIFYQRLQEIQSED